MTKREGTRIALGFCAGLAFAAGLVLVFGRASGSQAEPANAPPEGQRVIRYIRERFGLPDSENLTLEPFQASAYPGYYRATVVAQSGSDKRDSTITVSADGRYLILGDFIPIGPDPRAGIVRQATEIFKLPPTMKLSVGPFAASPFPNFLQTTITAENGGKVNKQKYYITRDRRYAVFGGIFNMEVDPRREALKTMKLSNEPSMGPANAPVTIVEYADMECPTCAREHQFLVNQVMPRYGNKVRVIFKEFPLVQIHTWAFQAAIAAQCVYQIDPTKYVPFRSRVFDNQENIHSTDVRDLMLYYGQQVGVDRLKLAACYDSKASLSRVDENMREAQDLGVDRTPTFFINGRKVIGGGPADVFFQDIDDALRASR